MSDRTNIKVGEVTVCICIPAGPPFMRCRSSKYGVVIGFTKMGNPRVHPLYYGKAGSYSSMKHGYKILFSNSTVIPDALSIDKEFYFESKKGGNLKVNYNDILKTIQNGKSKNNNVPTREKKKIDFSF